MIVRKLRLQRGWSQEHLAQLSGLSTRTIQRIERGHNPGLESLNSLAAVFKININELQQENDMTPSTPITLDEERAIAYVRDIKGFYSHATTYVLTIALLGLVNWLVTPHSLWVIFPALGWGIGLATHGLNVFEVFSFFSPEWEKKQIEKRLGKKL